MMHGTINIGCKKCRRPIGMITFQTIVPGQFLFYCDPCWAEIEAVTPKEAMDALLDEMNRIKQEESLKQFYGTPWHT